MSSCPPRVTLVIMHLLPIHRFTIPIVSGHPALACLYNIVVILMLETASVNFFLC
ncbi:hypothetical protein BDZ91DRAFT_727098 [Kalaharituber pfeilii]|nr:hypothetical protein BDZ91DRAFT_727098 [Kalaharituber pfeilii]